MAGYNIGWSTVISQWKYFRKYELFCFSKVELNKPAQQKIIFKFIYLSFN